VLIISRLAKHLRSANWGLLGLELLVVVVGLYLAFQLDRWAEDWKASRQEAVYLAQLHDELATADENARLTGERYRETLDEAREILVLLMQQPGSEPLSDEQCETIFALSTLSIVEWRPVTVVTVDEMISNGMLSELDDAELRRLLFSLQAETTSLSAFMGFVRGQLNVLMDDYPDLMPRGIDEQQQYFIRCNTDGMRRSQPFINHLASNRGRYGGLSIRWNSVQEVLHQAHVRLDTLLGIAHP
jgi:hypothetical protein